MEFYYRLDFVEIALILGTVLISFMFEYICPHNTLFFLNQNQLE